jgi:hypothetical protein
MRVVLDVGTACCVLGGLSDGMAAQQLLRMSLLTHAAGPASTRLCWPGTVAAGLCKRVG